MEILFTYGNGSSKLCILLEFFFFIDYLFFYLISVATLSESSQTKSLKFYDIPVGLLK